MVDLLSLGHLIGWVGFLIGICAFQAARGKQLLFIQIISNTFWTCHHFLIGGMAGAVTCFALIIRNSISLVIDEKYLKILAFAMIPIVFTAVHFVTESPWGYMSALGNSLAGLSVIYRDDSFKLRIVQIISSLFFALYGFMGDSNQLFLLASISMLSNIIGAIRHEEKLAPMRNFLLPLSLARLKGRYSA